MTDDLRAKAKAFANRPYLYTREREALAETFLTLLTSLEAAERERDSLRLELQASEYNRIKGNESLLAEKKAAERRAERLQIELGDAKERYQILAREAARVVDGACISESMQDLRDTLRALGGREEKV